MTEQTNIRTRSKLRGCLIFALFPLVLVGIAAIVLVINNRPPNIKVPSHGTPKGNGYYYFIGAGECVDETKYPGPYSSERPIESWKLSELESFVKANKLALLMLRQGLTKQYMHPAVRGIHPRFPDYSVMRKLARTLRGEALYCKKKGEYGKNADLLLDGIELGVTIPRGGVIITGLVGAAVEAIPMKDLPDTVHKLNAQELSHVASRLEVIQAKRQPFSEIVLEEGRYGSSFLAEMSTAPQARKNLMNPYQWIKSSFFSTVSSTDSAPTLTERFGRIWQVARFAFANKAKLIRERDAYCKTIALEQQKPYTGKTNVSAPAGLLSDWENTDYVRIRRHLDTAEARLSLIQTEVALRRYRLANGRYPDKLEQLLPKYIKNIPIDPFGIGRPLRYKPIGNGKSFLLYSLGPNMKDDGGKPVPGHLDLDTGDMLPNTASSLGL